MTNSKLGKYSPDVLFYGPCALFPKPCPSSSPTILPSHRLLPKFDSIHIYSVQTQRGLGSTYEGEQAVFFLLSLGHLVEYHTLLLGQLPWVLRSLRAKQPLYAIHQFSGLESKIFTTFSVPGTKHLTETIQGKDLFQFTVSKPGRCSCIHSSSRSSVGVATGTRGCQPQSQGTRNKGKIPL